MPVIASHIHQSIEKDLDRDKFPEVGLYGKTDVLVLLIMEFSQAKDSDKRETQ
jgi:hypothetical protein